MTKSKCEICGEPMTCGKSGFNFCDLCREAFVHWVKWNVKHERHCIRAKEETK